MDGKSKIELILELKNRMKTGLTKAKESVNSNVTAMRSRLNDLKKTHVAAFKAMRDEIPMLGRAFELLGNPYVMIAAGALAVGAIMFKGIKAAEQFQSAFLPIKQLNMDKPIGEMSKYQRQIKDSAFDVGANLKDTTNAFYDLQSGTGLFGKDAVDVFKKVGDYSLVTGANINDSMNSTVKAMRAFGLGVKDIDGLLLSNTKTVQMGIVTFDELAKVQTEYAGAASGAGQSVDTANKLFAAFTSVAKDANMAANMTKTAFQGLTQKTTVDNLQKMGVKMYDANGNMRDMASILGEVSQKFKGMSSKQVDEAINKIGGPEGLRAMFVKLKTSGDDFFNTLEGFDKSSFNFAQALKNAKGDTAIMANMAKNRLGIVMAEIGQKFLPIWLAVLEKVNKLLSWVYRNFETIWAVIKNVTIALGIMKVAMIAFNIITAANPIGAIISAVIALIGLITWLINATEGWGQSFTAIKKIIGIFFVGLKNDFVFLFDTITFGIQFIWYKFKELGESVKNIFGNITESIKLALHGDFTGAKKALSAEIKLVPSNGIGIDELKSKFNQKKTEYYDNIRNSANDIYEASKLIGIRRKRSADGEDAANAESAAASAFADSQSGKFSPGNAGKGDSNDVTAITGAARQIKNITINIDSFNKGGINTANTTLQNMNPQQIEEWFNNMLLRVIRNVELSY